MHIYIICILLFSLQGRSKNGYLNYPCVIFSNQTLQFQNGKIPKYIFEFFEYLFLLVQIIQSFTSPPHFYISLVWLCNFNVVFFKLMNISHFRFCRQMQTFQFWFIQLTVFYKQIINILAVTVIWWRKYTIRYPGLNLCTILELVKARKYFNCGNPRAASVSCPQTTVYSLATSTIHC